jgi:uncharacterized protein YbjT (DUF2867 family)
MKVLLFGATGMVGQGVLRECLVDPRIEHVLSVARTATGQQHEKLRELVHTDFFDFSPIESELSGFDACFFSLGVSSVGMTEQNYRRVTYDITMAAAKTLARLDPGMTFIYVSGMGADSSERGRSMWARVKGETENALLRQQSLKAYAFRPAAIVPVHGVRSKTAWYRIVYTLAAPLLPLLEAWFPRYVTTSEQVGRAMIKVTLEGAPSRILENIDINKL